MKKIIYICFLAACLSLQASAQTPSDAIMMGKGQICFGLFYTHDTWDEYWEGTLKRNNGNIGTLTRQTVMPMFSLGLLDRLNLLAALPWVRTEASAGQVKGAQGFQDWGVWLKGEAFKLDNETGDLTLHAIAGFGGPASNYLPDFAPFSLGLGCLDASLRGVLQYKLDKGPYARVTGAYHLRGNCIIERDYYYTTQGYYTEEVDMPNALTYGATIGTWLFDDSFKIEATYDGLKTLGGHDIRRQDAGFPSNRMIFTRVGGGLQYYFPFAPNLSVTASGGYVLSGRNVGQSLMLTGGVTYVLGLWQ
ncbi:MAG: transporter [Saprospirales bacterium]|nr:transporter [Saprospirales bacterium]